MARVLILTGDAAEELDSMYPVFRLREGGHEAVVAARTARAVKLVVHDFEPGCDAYTEKPGHQLPVDVAFGDVNPADYDALRRSRAGGRRSTSAQTRTWRASSRTSSSDGSRSARSATAPQVPAALGLLRGAHHGGVPAAEGRHGAGRRHVRRRTRRRGGAMVSCRGWPDLPEWSRAFLQVLERASVRPDERTHNRAGIR